LRGFALVFDPRLHAVDSFVEGRKKHGQFQVNQIDVGHTKNDVAGNHGSFVQDVV
jgi:hypothetical protein